MLDDILLLQEHVFGNRVSHLSQECAAEYTLPEFYCGVTPLAPDVLDECGLPGKEMRKQIEPLFERMSKQKRYLAAAMGSGVPIRGCHEYIRGDYIRALYPYPLRIRAGDAYPKCIMRTGGENISILSDRKCEIISDPYPRYESQDTGVYMVRARLSVRHPAIAKKPSVWHFGDGAEEASLSAARRTPPNIWHKCSAAR